MDFPNIVPSSRQFVSGDYPISRYTAVNGVEVRILRGSNRTGMQLQLTYAAITDQEAELFINHYAQQFGTFSIFQLVGPGGDRYDVGAKGGWGGDPGSLGAVGQDNEWRYAQPVQITGVYPGVSNVTVSLIGVLRN